jgi:UDP-perosamine 4-acetyltransferase
VKELPVIVIGAGGHAKVLIEALRCAGLSVLALTDRDVTKHGDRILDVLIAGDDAWLQKTYPPGKVRLVNGVGSVNQPLLRRKIFFALKTHGYDFATVIHPSAIVAADATLGEGTQIMAGAVIQPSVCIGVDTIVNTRASVDHDCIIGNHAHIAPGAILSGSVQIGDAVHVGAGATLIQGIHIGREALIAAGATVIRDVPAGVRVFGIPARRQK